MSASMAIKLVPHVTWPCVYDIQPKFLASNGQYVFFGGRYDS